MMLTSLFTRAAVRCFVVIAAFLLTTFTAAADRVPVPSANELKAAQAEIKDLFKADLAAAKSASQLTELAERMLGNIQNEDASRVADYTLLTQAQSVAVKASNIALTRSIVSRLALRYDVDEHQLATQAIKDLGKGPVDQTFHQELAELALQLASEAQAIERFDVASGYLETVSSAATKLKSTDLAKRAAAVRSDLTELKKLAEKVAAANKALTKNEGDPAANGIVGRYVLLAMRDWQRALPHLARSDDKAVQVVADADLRAITAAEPIAADEAVTIAINWWDIGTKQTVPGLKTVMRNRACQWYDFALPSLKALTKTKAEQRLSEAVWKPESVNAAKAPLNINMQELMTAFETANGLLGSDFAICQTASFDDSIELNKKLGVRQFRPIRMRPYPSSNGLKVAAIWIKDATPSDLFVGTSDEVQQHIVKNRAASFIPVDVASFIAPTDKSVKHLLISAKQILPKGIVCDVSLNYVSKGEVEYCKAKGVLPETFQRFMHPDGKLYSAMVTQTQDARSWTLRAGPLDWVLGQMKPTLGVAVDVGAIDQSTDGLQIIGAYHKNQTLAQHVGHGGDLSGNIDAWRKLAASGARPAAIGVCQSATGSYQTMWIWHSRQ